jgi:hypothetical protein
LKAPLRIVSVSDIHFGNKRISSLDIAEQFVRHVFPKLKDADLCILGGDFFDQMLYFSDEHTNGIVSLMLDLLSECDKYGVVLRILRGTFVHDRTQCANFKLYHEKGFYKNSLKYYDILSCEYIKELDLRVLYIPDDLPYKSSEEVMNVIYKMLHDLNWDKVDYVFGHGYFDHMLPEYIPNKPKCTFTVDQFRDIVRRLVIFGHVHFSNKTEFVLYNGSFPRLAHGEEEPKGFLYIQDDGKDAKIEFIENKYATKFLTFNLSMYDTVEESMNEYLKRVDIYKDEPEIYIRVIHPSNDVKSILSKLTKNHYPRVIYSHESGKDKPKSIKISDIIDMNELPVPTPDQLPQMIFNFLNVDGKSPLTEAHIEHLLERL